MHPDSLAGAVDDTVLTPRWVVARLVAVTLARSARDA